MGRGALLGHLGCPAEEGQTADLGWTRRVQGEEDIEGIVLYSVHIMYIPRSSSVKSTCCDGKGSDTHRSTLKQDPASGAYKIYLKRFAELGWASLIKISGCR